MAGIPGTNVAGPVVPFDSADTYATHDAQYGKGGFRSVATVAERDAIPAARRTEGMRVRVTADPTTSNNVDWDWLSGAWVAVGVPELLNTQGAAKVGADLALTYPANTVGSLLKLLFAGQSSSLIGKDTLANLNADLAHAAGTVGWVLLDTTPENNIQYLKTGASGSGAWVPASDSVITQIQQDFAVAAPKLDVLDVSYRLSGIVYALVDAANRMALGVNGAGRVILGQGGDVAARLDDAEGDLTTLTGALDTAQSGRNYPPWAVVDEDGRMPLYLDEAGNLWSKGNNLSNPPEPSAIADLRKWVTPSGYYWMGDSLSASGAPALLAALIGEPVAALAVGGQRAEQVAARVGAMVPLFTVAGNTIPESGGVAVTARSIDPITSQGGGPLTGSLAGVRGVYTSNGTSTWTFTRSANGDAVIVDPATPFLLEIPDDRWYGTLILWYGRNNVGLSTMATTVKEAYARTLAAMRTVEKRFVILSTITWYNEPTGSANNVAVRAMNDEIKALYPSNYLNVLDLLIRSGNGSTDDNADAAAGLIPRSLRVAPTDGHLNSAGNAIVAGAVHEFTQQKGWTE